MTLPPRQPHDPSQARELIARLCDRGLDPGEAATLEALLRADPAVRQYYIRAMSLHADLYEQVSFLSPFAGRSGSPSTPEVPSLHDLVITQAIRADDDGGGGDGDGDGGGGGGDGDGGGGGADATEPLPAIAPLADRPRGGAPWWRRRWAAAALVLATASVIGSLIARSRPSPVAMDVRRHVSQTSPDRPAGPSRVARLDASLSAVWAGDAPPVDGQALEGRELRLRSGLARLTTTCGVDMVLQGPADLVLETEGRVRLTGGRLTVRAPHRVPGFVVATPESVVVDLGTEFGVAVDEGASGPAPRRTDVSVFEGSVRIDAGDPAQGNGPGRLVSAGQTCSTTPAGAAQVSAVASPAPFVRVGDFDRDRAATDSAVAVVGRPDLLAWSLFDADFEGVAAARGLPPGLRLRTADGPARARLEGPTVSQGNAVGRTLVLEGNQVAYVDLDVTPDSRVARQGYLGPEGFVEASGKTLFLSWLSTAVRSAPDGYGGLSLVDGDQQLSNEYLFLGRAFRATNFTGHVWKVGRTSLPGSFAEALTVVSRSSGSGAQGTPVDHATHLWVLKVQFRPGNDHMSLFFDPSPAGEPSTPSLVVDTVDLRFNKVRLAAGPNDTWRFGRLLMGESYSSVVPGQ